MRRASPTLTPRPVVPFAWSALPPTVSLENTWADVSSGAFLTSPAFLRQVTMGHTPTLLRPEPGLLFDSTAPYSVSSGPSFQVVVGNTPSDALPRDSPL